jgi:hypothetical protein
MHRLEQLVIPAGYPKYGYLLESDEVPVGVKILIFSELGRSIRCNVSSWYVDPAFRSHATLLVSQALKRKEITYLNISPSSRVQPIIEAQGFVRYSNGQFVTFPPLSATLAELRSTVRTVESIPEHHCEPLDRELLLAHAEYGCISLWCVTADRAYPFVFLPRIVRGFVPCAQLVYCDDIQSFVRFARPVGLFLALRGRPFIIVDSNGPIDGLTGKYFDGVAPKYYKGQDKPRLGDLAYTEAAIFGL